MKSITLEEIEAQLGWQCRIPFYHPYPCMKALLGQIALNVVGIDEEKPGLLS